MFCCKCGKEISDQAQFCNFCGAQITGTQSGTAVAAQPAQQPEESRQERKAGKGILSVLVAVVVFFGVRYATENFLFSKKPDTASKTTTTTLSSGRIEINKPSPASTCYLGGLYQGGELIYGSAKLRIPGYSLLPGEGDAADFLMSPNGTVLVSVNKTLEVDVSYDASDEARMLKSFDNSGFANVRMIDFRKDEVDGYPVIRYIIRCDADGLDEYIGELIILPSKTANETMRITMYALAESGTAPIDTVFDSLSISPAYALGSGDTTEIGIQQITAK